MMFVKIAGWIISIGSAAFAILYAISAFIIPWMIGPCLIFLAVSAVVNPLIIAKIGFYDNWRRIGLTCLAFVAIFAISLAVIVRTVTPTRPIVRIADTRAFKDCDKCLEMVGIPAGTFQMGAAPGEAGLTRDGKSEPANGNEFPRHQVDIKSFAAGRFEVTLRDWDYCAASGGCQSNKAPDDNEPDGRSMPAVNISWDDAQEYVTWLSAKTGKKYRLLTEAEWEYAARAGSTTPYFWGATVGDRNEYCVCWPTAVGIRPVGSLKPNAFGLYDMSGNVAELTQDVGHNDYVGAPADGHAWMDEKNARRMAMDGSLTAALRGGNVQSNPLAVRSASRAVLGRDVRDFDVGFRVARDLP